MVLPGRLQLTNSKLGTSVHILIKSTHHSNQMFKKKKQNGTIKTTVSNVNNSKFYN